MTPWQKWYWVELLAALDRAGYAVVRKPTLTKYGPK